MNAHQTISTGFTPLPGTHAKNEQHQISGCVHRAFLTRKQLQAIEICGPFLWQRILEGQRHSNLEGLGSKVQYLGSQV